MALSDVLSDLQLDHSSPVPLYHQAAQWLEQAIADGRLPPGTKLDNEISLAQRLGISRPTIRAALTQLVDKGLLIRRRGIGTVVAATPVNRQLALTSLYDDLEHEGRLPTTQVLKLEQIPCPADAQQALQLEESELVHELVRVRCSGSEPIALMHNVLPAKTIELGREELEAGGLYAALRRQGVIPQVARQRVGAAAADAEQAELLGVEPASPLVAVTRTAYDHQARPVEFAQHRYPAHTYAFEATLIQQR